MSAKVTAVSRKWLTNKQSEFVGSVHGGATYADAYRRAYSAERMLPETIHTEASRVASNPQHAE